MATFPTFKGLWPWPWIGSMGSYYITSCITRRPLPTYQISLKSKKLFVDGWMDVRTDRCMDGHLRPTLLGRLGAVDLTRKHRQSYRHADLCRQQQHIAISAYITRHNKLSRKGCGNSRHI